MDDNQILDWLKLAQLSGLKRNERRQLIERFGDTTEILDLISSKQIKTPEQDKLKQQLALIHQHHIQVLPWGDPAYPPQLAELADAPIVLFVQGELALLARPQIAMVGSRSASPGGLKTAFDFARDLSRSGITITSGLALGIDGACHKGALGGISGTIGVVATGLDQVYPRRHSELATQIRQNGALLSEFAPLTAPRRESFPQRNRIISGLSLGVLVVEAGTRSGSLITARLAGEQGRDIFAIPGSIHLPTSRGCHQLIRQGAKLVETTADVLVEIKAAISFPKRPPTQSPSEPSPTGAIDTSLNEKTSQLLAGIDYAPTPLETLIEQSQLPIDEISSMLLQLEIDGYIASCAGGQYQRIQ